MSGETYKTTITVADVTNVKSVDIAQMFVFEKVTAANMFPPKSSGTGIYTIDKLTMLDKVVKDIIYHLFSKLMLYIVQFT